MIQNHFFYNTIPFMNKITDIQRFLSAYLKKWITINGLTQAEASARLSINQAQLNGILNLTRGISIEKLEMICYATGKKTLDALLEGRELVDNKNHKIKNEGADLSSAHRKAIEAFHYVILHGGEAAEMIAKNAIELAQKKQAEAEDPTKKQGLKSAS